MDIAAGCRVSDYSVSYSYSTCCPASTNTQQPVKRILNEEVFPVIPLCLLSHHGTRTKVLKYIAKTTQLSQKPGNCKCSVVRSAMTYYIGVSARLMSTPVSNRTLWGGSGLETTVKYTQGCHTSLRSWANIGYSSEKCDLNLEKHPEAVTGPTFLKRIKYRTCSQHCEIELIEISVAGFEVQTFIL